MDARRADFNRSGISGLLFCGGQLFVIVVQPLPALAHPLSSTFPPSQLHARSFCFPRFTFDPFFSFALDVLRWADTCILVSSLRRSIFAKGTYLKLTFRESRALFGAPFFLSPAFSPSTLVFCRLFTSLSFTLSLFRPFPSSLRNESCIRFFRSTILIPVVNFPFLSLPLFLSLSISLVFFLLVRMLRIFVFLRRITLPASCPPLYPCLLISCPLRPPFLFLLLHESQSS